MISLSLEPFPDEWAQFCLETFRDLDGRGIFSFTERETVRLVPGSDGDAAPASAPEGGEYVPRDGLMVRYPDTFADLSGYRGGVVYDGTDSLDVLDYAMTLKWLAERDGAGIFRDHAVTDLRVEDGVVETEYGPVDADHVVYATGWKTRDLFADVVELPV